MGEYLWQNYGHVSFFCRGDYAGACSCTDGTVTVLVDRGILEETKARY